MILTQTNLNNLAEIEKNKNKTIKIDTSYDFRKDWPKNLGI